MTGRAPMTGSELRTARVVMTGPVPMTAPRVATGRAGMIGRVVMTGPVPMTAPRVATGRAGMIGRVVTTGPVPMTAPRVATGRAGMIGRVVMTGPVPMTAPRVATGRAVTIGRVVTTGPELMTVRAGTSRHGEPAWDPTSPRRSPIPMRPGPTGPATAGANGLIGARVRDGVPAAAGHRRVGTVRPGTSRPVHDANRTEVRASAKKMSTSPGRRFPSGPTLRISTPTSVAICAG